MVETLYTDYCIGVIFQINGLLPFGVFHQEMKIHGMNGKVIALLESPPA